MKSLPPGMRLVPSLWANEWSHNTHRRLALFLTFVAPRLPQAHQHRQIRPHPRLSPFLLLLLLLLPPLSLGLSAPFNGTDGSAKVSELDFAFLSCYTIGLYAAGMIGMGYFWHLRVFGFYLAVQMLAGLFQPTGWLSIFVAVVGNWLGEQGRGLLMGIRNAHTSVGNRVGSVLEDNVLRYGQGCGFHSSGWGSGVLLLGTASGGCRV